MSKLLLNKIQELRWEYKMTIEELSHRSKVSKSEIHKIENHKRVPSQYTIVRISKAFGKRADEVFNLEYEILDYIE